MKRILWVVAWLASFQFVFAQSSTFSSALEESILKNPKAASHVDLACIMGQKDPDGFKVLLEQKLAVAEALAQKAFANKKDFGKNLDALHKSVCAEILLQYVETADLDDVVRNGQFNCLSGSMFYCLLFDRIGVEYQIQKAPNHVFLLVGPQKIAFETTFEGAPTQFYSKTLQSTFLTKMVMNGTLSEDDARHIQFSQGFGNDVNTVTSIDWLEFASMHYMNDASIQFKEGAYLYSAMQAKKAHMLFPLELFQEFSIMAYAMDWFNYPDHSEEKVFSATLLLNESGKLFSEDIKRKIWMASAGSWFEKHEEDSEWNELRESLVKMMPGDTLIPFFEWYRAGILITKYCEEGHPSCAEWANRLMELKPDHSMSQITFISARSLAISQNIGEYLDSIPAWRERYPGMRQNKFLDEKHQIVLLVLAGIAFEAQELEKAENYLKELDQYSADQKKGLEHDLIGNVYSAGVNAYVRVPNYPKAKAMLLKGLELAPYSTEIARSKRVFGETLGVK